MFMKQNINTEVSAFSRLSSIKKQLNFNLDGMKTFFDYMRQNRKVTKCLQNLSQFIENVLTKNSSMYNYNCC